MPHYTDEQIQAANQCDLAAFLISRGERLKKAGSQYLWESRQVWIRGNKWYTHYDAVGGHAVSFVMKYFGMPFQDAVAELLGETVTPAAPIKRKEKTKQELILPEANTTMNRVYAYLMNERFIARDVISFFAHNKTLYEDAEYHNCVFVGLDENGVPKHCHRRGTAGASPFKQTVSGSLAEYSFHYDGKSEWLFAFEAPIDMLAFITLHQYNWQKHSYVALCCVSEQAILHRLKVNPKLTKIVLCLDNDDAGAAASQRIKESLAEHGYTDVRILKSVNKDWDEDAKEQNGIAPVKASADSTERIRELCRDYVREAQNTKQPPMLRNRVSAAHTSLMNSWQNISKEQLGDFPLQSVSTTVLQTEAVLLLLLAKDECRKSLSPIKWTELETRLAAEYILYTDNGDKQSRLRQLDSDMKTLNAVYAKEQQTCDRNAFLKPILRVCMDCIRLINYHERKETSQWVR